MSNLDGLAAGDSGGSPEILTGHTWTGPAKTLGEMLSEAKKTDPPGSIFRKAKPRSHLESTKQSESKAKAKPKQSQAKPRKAKR